MAPIDPEGVALSEVVVVGAHGALKRADTSAISGLEVRPGDLSPVLAVQQMILHVEPPTQISFADSIRSSLWSTTLFGNAA